MDIPRFARSDTGVDSRPYQAKHGGWTGMQAETGIGEGRGNPVGMQEQESDGEARQ